jgi:tetratricopeptide (TPR) repeat protein
MDWITITVNWFGENESILSGIAAFVVIFGLLLSPLGGYFKIFRAKPENTAAVPPPLTVNTRQASKPAIYIEPFTANIDEARAISAELNEEVRRAVTNFTGSILVTDIALANYIASVNVLLSGDHCRTTLRLHDIESNEDFWSGRFEADVANKLVGIDRLSAKLSNSIRYEVSTRFTGREDDTFEVELGRMGFAMTSLDRAVWDEARVSAEKWLEEKSDNSMLQAIYGGLLMHELVFGYQSIGDGELETAGIALRKSVALNDRSDFAHTMLARYLLYGQLDIVGAGNSYQRSLRINPLYNFGLKGLAFVDIYGGDTEKGLELCKDLDPNTQYFQVDEQTMRTVAAGEMKLGNFDEALDWAEQAIRYAGSATTPSLIMVAAAAGLAGKDQVASQAVASLKEKHPEITIDTLRRWPYKDDADWELFVSGLRKAGLE